MATLTRTQMIDRTRLRLQGLTVNQNAMTVLTSPVDSDDLDLPVHDASTITTGMVEIGNELVWVDQIDPDGNIVKILPGGRGWAGTTAASHATGTAVVNNPRFPRAIIDEAITTTLSGLYPTLFQVKKHTFDWSTRSTYILPEETSLVLAVRWESVGSSKEQVEVRRWNADNMFVDPVTGLRATGIQISDSIIIGQKVHVFYTAEPGAFTSNWSDTGLPDAVQDVVMWGAAANLVGFLEPGYLDNHSVEASMLAQQIPAGSSTNAARFLYQMFLKRMEEERNALLSAWPVRVHRMR